MKLACSRPPPAKLRVVRRKRLRNTPTLSPRSMTPIRAEVEQDWRRFSAHLMVVWGEASGFSLATLGKSNAQQYEAPRACSIARDSKGRPCRGTGYCIAVRFHTSNVSQKMLVTISFLSWRYPFFNRRKRLAGPTYQSEKGLGIRVQNKLRESEKVKVGSDCRGREASYHPKLYAL